MSEAEAIIDKARALPSATIKNGFLALLLGASLAPIAFFLLLHPTLPAEVSGAGQQLLIFLAIAHVPITAFFWFDDRYRAHINANWRLYYLAPVGIIAAAGAVPLAFGSTGADYLFLFYFVWLLWHYGKQNWGILCLFSFGTKTSMPSKLHRWICNAAPVFGALGATAGLAQAQAFAPVLPLIYWAGAVGTAIVAAATLYAVSTELAEKLNWRRIVMTATCGLFFVPTFLSVHHGVLAYATAHACQYFVMMYALAADRKQRAIVLRLAAITVAAVGGYFVQLSFNDTAIWGQAVIVGTAIGTGITMSHFFLDSHLWRLREPFQRGAIKESFAFLFR